MNLKNKSRKFFTLSRQHEAGFTLVELIVVIAILAILGGVAVPVYSGYMKKANKQADLTLAAEIENALLMAHYSGTLKEGATVIVKYGEAGDANVVVVDPNGDLGTAAALTAAFGDNYAETLRLKYDGWEKEIGVAGDSFIMENVNNSNFQPQSMDNLLNQLQLVVNEANKHLLEGEIAIDNDEVIKMMNDAGIEIEKGEKLDSTNSMAAANAYVFAVSGELAGMEMGDEAWTTNMNNWGKGEFPDGVTNKAAEYASVLALATYVDKQVPGSNFAAQMYKEDMDPRTVAKTVREAIKTSEDAKVQAAWQAYTVGDEENGVLAPSQQDYIAFLAYMQGVTDSSDSLLNDRDLSSNNYFNDGYVAGYVKNYISISDVLTGLDIQGNVLVFVYDGNMVACMPVDY